MKKTLFSIAVLAAAFHFTGCYDAIFYNIRNEVPLEDGIINGYTNSIVRYQKDGKEFLYLQNGTVYYKQISNETGELTANQSHDAWEEDKTAPGGLEYSYYDEEFSGSYSCVLASDEKYIYMLGATPEYDQDNGRNVLKNFTLYYSDGTKWEEIPAVNEIIRAYEGTLKDTHYMMDASIQLFCTNAPQKEHRKAYIRIGGGSPYHTDVSSKQEYGSFDKNDSGVMNCGIIKLDGPDTTAAVIPLGSGKIGGLEKTGAGKNTLSAVYANDTVYFLDYVAASTNETKGTDATWIYFGEGKELKSHHKEVLADEVLAIETLGSLTVLKDEAEIEKKEVSVIETLGTVTVLKGESETETEEIDLLKAFLSGKTYYELNENNEKIEINLSEKITAENKKMKIVSISEVFNASEPYYRLTGEENSQIPEVFSLSEKIDLLEAFLSGKTYYELNENNEKIEINLSKRITDENTKMKTVLISEIFAASKAYYYLAGEKDSQKPMQFLLPVSTSGCDKEILSLCVTKDAVILGTDEKGAYYVATEDGKPAKSTSDFPKGMKNADTVMCDPYIVRVLFCTDPSLGATDSGSALYSALQFRYTESVASASYKNVGLWSYYSSRGNWNKE